MICKYCGTNNRDNDAYCAYCGKPLSGGDLPVTDLPSDTPSTNIPKILAMVISIALVLVGGFLLLEGNLFGSDASIDGVVVDGDYEMEGDTYVFAVNETVVLDPQISSSNQDVDLRYELEDNSVANVVKLDNKCSLVGMKPQQTNLNIYEGDNILKVIKIAFKDNSDSNGDVSDNTEDNNAANNRGSSASRNRNNSSSSRNNSSSSNSNGSSKQGSSSESIPLDDLTYFMSSYLNDYQDAMCSGRFSIISGQLTSNGPLYKQLKTAVPDTYNKGIVINLRSCDKVAAKQISNGVYSLTYTVDWEIYNPEEDSIRVQREYGDYIVQKSGSGYKLDRMENWEILSKQYL